MPARALDAADRQRMILVDHPFGHGRGRERKVVALDHPAQQLRIAHTHGRRAENRNRPAGGCEQLSRPDDGVSAAVASRIGCARAGTGSWWRQRDVLRQIEMHRTLRLAQRQPDRLRQCLGDASWLEPQRGLGDRLEQGMVVDPHLDAPAELIGIEVAGDRDHWRAVEPGVADAGREIGRTRSERRDAKPGRAGHPAGDIGGKAGGAFMGGEHELDAAHPHGFHQRQHIAARDAESALDPVRLERCDDQIRVVHETTISWPCAPQRHRGRRVAPLPC